MKKYVLLASVICLLSAFQAQAQMQRPSTKGPRPRGKVDSPEVPRVSAYKAYIKHKAGRAMIIQAGGEDFMRRHVMGAINVPFVHYETGKRKLPDFPKTKIEIFIYCY